MGVYERMARLGDRGFDRLRDKQAFKVDEAGAVDGDFSSLRGSPYALLVTFRRNREAMPTPVWLGVDDAGVAYVKTRRDAGKVKRLGHDGRALLAPSNWRGRPTGPAIRGAGRVLQREEWDHAEATLAAAYGTTRAVFERAMGGPEELAAYIEIRPGR